MTEARSHDTTSGGPIPDDAVVALLRPFVRATRPILAGLRESDPFGLRSRLRQQPGPQGAAAPGETGDDVERGLPDKILDALASIQVPGTSAWASMTVTEREHWWVYRVGRFTTLVAAVPGLGGALAKSLPVSAAVGAAGQGMLLVAVAGEHGVTDEDTLVALLASVLFRRDVRAGTLTPEADAAADATAAELTGDLETGRRGPGSMLRRVGSAVWRLGRALFAVEDELDKRPHGRFYHEWISYLPVVGAVGKYLGEWAGLKRAAANGRRWLTRRGLAAD